MNDTDALAPPSLRWPAPAGSEGLAVLRAHPLARAFGRFLGVGLVGLATDALVFTALDLLHLAPEMSRAVSIGAATLVTWRLNRRHTFGASGRAQGAEALRYAAVALGAQGFSYAVFLSLIYGFPFLPRLIPLLAGAGLAAFAGFAGHKLFAFAPPAPPRR